MTIPEILRWCTATGRFFLLKDTCCDPEQMRVRQETIQGTGFQIFNANAATLLETLRMGLAGYSGVMANFQPELYAWLCGHWKTESATAEALQAFLGLSSAVEGRWYPRNAKYYQQLEEIPITLHGRRPADELRAADKRLVEQLRELTTAERKKLGLK